MTNAVGNSNATIVANANAAIDMIKSGNVLAALQLIMSEKSQLMTDQITDIVVQMDANNKKMKALTDASAQLTKLTGAPVLAATRCCEGAALNTITLPR